MRLLVPSSLAFALVLVRCSVGDLDVEGKACPCVAGYTCDPATSRCVRGAVTAPDTGTSSSSSTSSSGGGLTDAPTGAFAVTLTKGWSTAQSMRWDWEVEGDPAAFDTYRLVVADTADAVDRPTSKTLFFDKLTNPELGSFTGRDPATPSPGRGWTVTDRLPVDAAVFARLKVIDKEGRENVSDIVEAHTTTKGTVDVVLLDPPALVGTTFDPSTIAPTNDCFAGVNGCFKLKTTCEADPNALACSFDIGVRGYALDLASMTAATFEHAFFDLAVRATAQGNTSAAPYNDVVLTLGNSGCPATNAVPCRFRWERGWSFRRGANEFRVVQVPLKELRLQTPNGLDRAMTFDDIKSNQSKLRAFTLDGTWTNGMTITFDRGSLRY